MATALGFSALSTVVFILAPGLGWLYLGLRAVGLMTGAAAAALTEMVQASASRRASTVATAANMGGAGLGPLIAGLFAQYLPQPTVLVFEAYLGFLALAALALVFVPETVTRRRRLSLRFTGLAIPRRPARVHRRRTGRVLRLRSDRDVHLAGAGLRGQRATSGELRDRGGRFVPHLRRRHRGPTEPGPPRQPPRHPRRARSFPGRAVVDRAGLSAASLALFLAGTVAGGIAVGALFIGSLSTANRLAPADSRAQVLSTYFVFAYSGLIIPVVGVGTAADYVGDFRAVLGCSVALAALCVWSATAISGRARAALARSPAACRGAVRH